jgi:hypothetical protein
VLLPRQRKEASNSAKSTELTRIQDVSRRSRNSFVLPRLPTPLFVCYPRLSSLTPWTFPFVCVRNKQCSSTETHPPLFRRSQGARHRSRRKDRCSTRQARFCCCQGMLPPFLGPDRFPPCLSPRADPTISPSPCFLLPSFFPIHLPLPRPFPSFVTTSPSSLLLPI